MSEFRDHPAAALLRAVPVDEQAMVPLKRVVRQRAAFTELYAATLLQPSLDVVLAEACRVAADGCDAPLAKVLEHKPREGQFLIVAGFGWEPGVVGDARAADDPTNPAGEAFRTQHPVALRDVRQRQDYHLPPIYPRHHIVSTSNVPITGASGFYGVLEVDRRDERPFDALDTSFLAGVAGVVADSVERVRRQAALQAAHDARAVLLREHHHRVRNNYQSVIARLQRHARQASTEDSRRRFQDVERRVFALAALYDHLVGADLPEDRVDFARYIDDLCRLMRDFYDIDERKIALACGHAGGGVALDLDTCTALGTVVNELVANAIEHAFGPEGGRVEIGLRHEADGLAVTVADDGAGLSPARPESIGLSVAHDLVARLGGRMAATADGGTTWTITLPPTIRQ